jgi:hypothetical protein
MTVSRRATVAALISLALTALGGRCSAVTESEYARLRFLPHQTPDVYLQFEGKWLVIATSAKGLETAKPIKALPANGIPDPEGEKHYVFPESELPVSLPGIVRVTATFVIFRPTTEKVPKGSRRRNRADEAQPGLWDAEVRISRKDSVGAVWTYTVRTGGEPTRSDDADKSLLAEIPSLDSLGLAVTTKPSEGKLGIGLRLTAGKDCVYAVRRNDDSRLALVQVTDANDAAVASETGDLEKFGFT